MDFYGDDKSKLVTVPGGSSLSESTSATGSTDPPLRVAIEATFNTEIKTADSLHSNDPATRVDAEIVDDVRRIEACIANPSSPGRVFSLSDWAKAWGDHQVAAQNPLPLRHGCPFFLWASPGDAKVIRLERAETVLANASEVGLVVVAGCRSNENGFETMTVRDDMTHGEGNGMHKAPGTPYLAHNFYRENSSDKEKFLPTCSIFDGRGLVGDLRRAGAKPETIWLIFLERSSQSAIPTYRTGPSPKPVRQAGKNTTFARLANELREIQDCKVIKLAIKGAWTSDDSPNASGQELANRSRKKVIVQEFRTNEVTKQMEFGWVKEFTPAS
ncbi:hypothetical protein ACJ41O_012506 [Fusarium nematophilum]